MSHLEVRDVTLRYGQVTALDEVSLTVVQGSRAAVVGPSGSGKSTLLRVIAGFETPDTGSVTLDGRLLANPQSIVPTHQRQIGIVSQHGALFPHLSVAANIGFGLSRSLPNRDRRIDTLLETVELDPAIRNRRPDQLSGGQQQRVALARALALQPTLMLLDEPFSALDSDLRESLRRVIGSTLKAAGITTVLVTHDQREALSFADHVAVMRAGRIVQAGNPRDLYLHPVDDHTALVLGDALVLKAHLGEGCADCALGRILANTNGHSGTGDIMLRKEQLWLEPISEETLRDAAPSCCVGRIVERDFEGATCTATVALRDSPGGPKLIRVTVPSFQPCEPGMMVRVGVKGTAHVLR